MMSGLKNAKFIDLFAGIGGFHQALSSVGADCVFACEWDMHAANTYAANYHIKPDGDITKIAEADIPQHDILCAGFPCQAFSISGKQKGFDDTRGTLFFEIARIVNYHKPNILFLENVKNFARHDNGNTLNITLKILDELGYDVYYEVLNASDYGLPQNRERIYIIAFKKTLGVNAFSFPKKYQNKVALSDFLEPNAKAKIVIRDDVVFKDTDWRKLSPSDLPNKPVQIGIVGKGGQGERIYHPLGHAIILSAYGGGVGAKTGLYLIDGQIRKLSPREYANIQGFDKHFKIVSSEAQSYK